MSSQNLDRISRELVEMMPLVFREIAKREDNELTRGKISFPQMVALDLVSRKPQVTMTYLAGVLSIKTSSATVLVDRLIRQRMLIRKRDEKDRRLVWVMITARGKKVVRQIMEQKRKSMRSMLAVLTDKEREQYLAAVKKIQANLLKDSMAAKE